MQRATSLALVLAAALCPLAAAAQVVQGPNGHYYEWVPEPVFWDVAMSIAGSSQYQGLQGYLATVTSDEENTFVADVALGNLAWLGGSDAGAAINDWTWRAGPEAGQAFTYTNWGGDEPNNCCNGEDYLHINWAGFGLWNDHGGPGNAAQQNGFVIEYSAPVPEPAGWALMLAGLAAVGGLRRRR